MPNFKLKGQIVAAEQCVGGVFVNPVLPELFDLADGLMVPNPVWWNRPYVVTETLEGMDAFYAVASGIWAEVARKLWLKEGRASWLKVWPSGTRFETRCLDGGALDSATSWGLFQNIEAALECARTGHTLNIKEKFHDYSQARG